MLEQIIEPTLLTQFKEALENSGNVVVTCHKSPDGDAAGSNLALKLILDKLGKKATVVTPDNQRPGDGCRDNQRCRPYLLPRLQRIVAPC